MNQTWRIFASAACILLAACQKDDPLSALLLPGGGESPAVVLTHPSPGQSGVDSGEQPWVLFSQTMDMQKTQSAFRLSSGAGQIPGGFRWEGTRMIFTPSQGLTGAAELTMTIGADSESERGVDLGEAVTVRFYAQTDTQRPAFVQSNPANGSTGVSTSGDIVLEFSEAMDLSTAQSGISISPAALISFIQNTRRNEIILRPLSPLSPGLYSIQITTGLTDISGNALDQNYSISVTAGADFSAPSVTGASAGPIPLTENLDTHGVLRTDSIILTFSEPMDRTSVENALSLSPFALSTKTWDALSQTMTVAFSGALEPDTRYTMTLGSAARDAAGNPMLSTHVYPFYTDASSRPAVLAVRQAFVLPAFQGRVDNAAVSGALSSPLSDHDPLGLAHQIDELPAVGASDFVIHLQVQFDRATMLRTTLVTGTSVVRILDPGSGNLSIYGLDLTGDTMTLKLYGSPFPGGTGTPIYRLRISGARDSAGNAMSTDYNLYLTF